MSSETTISENFYLISSDSGSETESYISDSDQESISSDIGSKNSEPTKSTIFNHPDFDATITSQVIILSESCKCQLKCYFKETAEQWARWLVPIQGMSKKTRFQHIICLVSPSFKKEQKRSHPIYQLPFVGKVCRSFFCTFWNLGRYQLRRILHDISSTRSILPRMHGNTQKNPPNQISAETKIQILQFLETLKTKHGEAIATRVYKRHTKQGTTITKMETANLVLLPSHYSYRRLCQAYNEANPSNATSRSTFYRIWKSSEFKTLKIRRPSKDVCDDCTIIRNSMRAVNPLSPETTQSNSQQLLIHLNEYRKCREAYESDIRSARHTQKLSTVSTIEQQTSDSATSCHSFDFQQVVEIPHIPQQPSQWYYWSPFKIYVFGIVNEGTDQHYHSLYTEAQQGKGANEVVSLLHTYLTAGKNLSSVTHLWADNCGGQNKNKTMIWYLSWLTLQGIPPLKVMELRFQIKGHTRNSVDRGFALTKNEANREEIWHPNDYIRIIENASKHGHILILPASFIDETPGGFFRNWDEALSRFMRPIDGIQKFQFFRFEVNTEPGLVKMKRLPEDKWVEFNVLKRGSLSIIDQLKNISPVPLSDIGLQEEKRHDMWSKYRQYTPPHLQNSWLYEEPSQELILRVRGTKSGRRKGKAKAFLVNKIFNS